MEENRRNSDRNSFKKRSRKKRKKKVLKNVLLSICLIISIAAGYFAARAQVMFNQSLNHVKRNYDSALATVDLSGIHVDSDNDIVNLLFIGNDHRKEWNGFVEEGLPDVMMIGTLDKKHKSLKLTSLLRDMKIYSSSSGKYRKLNECFNDGGIKGIYKAIAENFNIKLDGYVMVGFDAFTQAINTIGGVEVELTQTEVDYLSKTNFIRKKKYRKGLKVGKQKLNGYQALGYCRIRKGYDVIGKPVVTANGLTDDYGRTWRQRTVISKMIEAAKTAGISKLLDCINVVVDDVASSLTEEEIIDMAKSCFNYKLSTTTGFPFTIASPTMDEVSYVVACDLATNVTALHRFLFDDMNYTPSATVQNISYNIINDSGCENQLDLDTFTVQDDVDSIVSTESDYSDGY